MSQPQDEEVIEAGPLRIWPTEFVAKMEGEPLHLTYKEFLLLLVLASSRGRLVTRDRIGVEVWGTRPEGRTLDIHMTRLRAKLPRGAIQTVVRVGYRLVL